MSLKQQLVVLVTKDGASRRELCRRFGISPQTGYKSDHWHGVYNHEWPHETLQRLAVPA